MNIVKSKNNLVYCIGTAIITSIVYVFYLYPLSFLLGQGDFFNIADPSINVSGWLSYCADTWHYPFLHTKFINYPEGASIAFTDSIPLAAIFFKAIKSYLPEHFHYIGLWHGFAYLSQGLAAVVLVRAAGFKSYFASLTGILFALSSPILLWRLDHAALMTHSLILLSLANYFCFIRTTRSFEWVANAQIAILFCSFLIHPYLFAINFVVMLALFIISLQRNKSIFLILNKALLLAILIGVAFVIFGYKGNNMQDEGFERHGLNLSTPFSYYDATGSQYEGYNYLGGGIIFLLFLSMFLNRKLLFQQLKKHHILIILFVFYTLFAFSNKIYFRDTLLLEYKVPNFLESISNTFRVSGRFFWAPFYFITFISIFGVLQLPNKTICITVITIAFMAQFLDLKDLRDKVIARTHKPSNANVANWKDIVDSIDGLIIFPFVGNGISDPWSLLKYQRIASYYYKFTNTSYIARPSLNFESKLRFISEYQPEKALYLIQLKELEQQLFSPFFPSTISNLISYENCPIQDGYILCIKGKSREWWTNRLGHCEFYSTKLKWPSLVSFDAIDLPTQIGLKESTFLVSEEGKTGFLSFGPYMRLQKGTYKATINFLSSNNFKDDVGFWDINAMPMDKQLIANNIINTDGSSSTIETIFEVTPELEHSNFEVRTFSNGKGRLVLKSIMIERM